MSFLKNHPFAVEAFFRRSVVLTYAVPKQYLAPMIPPCLALDTHNDQFAFLAVAMVDTTQLRPQGFPRFLGQNFFLIGYRIFVRFTNKQGKRLRGLYILKSETNKPSMEWLGNLFTHYQYSTTDITISNQGPFERIWSRKSKFEVAYIPAQGEVFLPPQSPFSDWKEARRFAGPLPHTFSVNEKQRTVLIIEGLREQWTPQPVSVVHAQFDFINSLAIPHMHLANAFIINNIPYTWKKGRSEAYS